MITKPEQLIHSTKKTKEWYEENGKYFLEAISYIDAKVIQSRLDKACGNITETDYNYATNPYGDLVKNPKELPAKLANKDIISPIMKQLIGEWLRRDVDPIVFNKNSDLSNAKKEMHHKLALERLQQEFVNTLVSYGAFIPGQVDEKGQPIQPPMSKEAIEEKLSNMVDEKSINGQYKLDYVYNTSDIRSTLKSIFYYYIAGLGISYKDIVDDNIVYKLVKPRDFGYVAGENVKYIKDSEAVKCKYKVQYSDLLVLFDGVEGFDLIKDDIKNSTDTTHRYNSYQDEFNRNFYGSSYKGKSSVNEGELKKDECLLTHIQWKGLTTIYRKHIVEPDGTKTHIDLDDRYEPSPDDIIEKKVCIEYHEIWCINNKWYIAGQVLNHSSGDFDNPNKGGFSYNGVTIQHYLDNAKTIIDSLDPYQEAYNVCDFMMQKAVNKNKGKIATIPLSLLNGFKDTQVETIIDDDGKISSVEVKGNFSAIGESLYFADATQLLFVDDAELDNAKAQLIGQLLKVLDLSTMQEIEYFYNYKERIKEEAYEHVGFNRGRRGAAGERDAVSNTREAQYVGSLITEELFEDFRLFTELEFGDLLNLANFLYKDGLKGQYLNSNYELTTVDIPPVGLGYGNLGIVVRSGGRERENFEMMRQNIQAMTQNGYTPSMIATLLSKSTNFDKVIKELKVLEAEQAQRAGAAGEQANQLEMQKLKLEKQKLELERIKILGNLEIEARKVDLEFDKTGINPLDTIKVMNENTKAQQEAMFKLADVKLKQADIAAKKYSDDTALAIAKENKGQ